MALLFATIGKYFRFFFSKGQQLCPRDLESELNQARMRAPLIAIVVTYTITSSFIVSQTLTLENWAIALLTFYACYALLSIFIFMLIIQYPGNYPARRIFGMLCDYVAASFAIIAGCTVMLPVYVFIVWITLGNGMRFGRHYLIVASFFAQLALASIFVMTPHWQADPILALTLSVTALVVPAYAYALLRAKERAELATQEAVNAKSRFLAQASHDLRQPIHAMNLFLSSLKQTKMTVDQNVLVERLDRSLNGIAALFKSLLDISSLDGGSVAPSPGPISVQMLFTEIAQQLGANSNPGHARIRFVASRRWLYVDPILLQNIVLNLISNALKHAPGSELLIGCRTVNKRVSIMVCDQGPGIGAEHMSQLFDEFYQIKSIDLADRSGVGLGLAIVRRLAETMHLRAQIKSVPGRGTTAYIHHIPEVAPQPIIRQTSLSISAKFRPLAGVRVLLVEDDLDVLVVTEKLLRSWGCIVEASSTLPAEPNPCDLIVTDLNIGGDLTGIDVIYEARKSCGRDIPAIIVTGYEGFKPTKLIIGSQPLMLAKPLTPAELRSAISTMRAVA